MDFSLFRKPKSVVGLDIGSSAVKAIELKPQGKNGFKIAAFASEPVPPDTIVDGAIIDAVAVADAIRRIFDSKRFKATDVVASLSGSSVIVKKIALPVMTEAELAESIHWEAEQYIPFDIQDVNIDYQVLDAGGAESGKQTMDVLLVAAKKDKIADYAGVIAQAGRTPVVVDVDAFARPELLRGQLRRRPGRRRCSSTPAPRPSTSTSSAATSRSSRATSRSAATPTPRRSRRSSACLRGGRAGQEGHAGRRRAVRGRPAGAAHDERGRAARNPEDVRLLQGDDLDGPDRSHRAVRRRVARGRLRRAARRALRHAGRAPGSVQDDGVRRQEARRRAVGEIAPTAAVAVGLALRKAGDR